MFEKKVKVLTGFKLIEVRNGKETLVVWQNCQPVVGNFQPRKDCDYIAEAVYEDKILSFKERIFGV